MNQQHIPRGPYEKYIKRPLDFIIALLALIVSSPVLAIIALIVMLKLNRPIVFVQERPGMIDKKTGQEKIFNMYKFRSMSDQRSEDGNLLPDKERLTPFGRVLRASSLDEILELFNVLKGDMSLVGPRPLLVKYLPYYTEKERLRHSVRPGLTGLAQINGRNGLEWEDRLSLDVEYAENITFLGDVKIILKTIIKVIKKEDVVDAGELRILDLDQERRNIHAIYKN